MKILIVYYSMYGHIWKMAQAVAEGAREVRGAKVDIRRTTEILPDTVLEKMGVTGQLWASGALAGKVGSVFTCSTTQHGSQESTILSTHITLLHLGMVIVGLPYSFKEQITLTEITGCSPYGASTIAGGKGERMPSEGELADTRY